MTISPALVAAVEEADTVTADAQTYPPSEYD